MLLPAALPQRIWNIYSRRIENLQPLPTGDKQQELIRDHSGQAVTPKIQLKNETG
jgi:hypothetical protein